MNTPDDAELELLRAEVDTKLDGVLAGIVRETFAAEERVHANGWDAMPTTVVQYLWEDSAPSSVATVPIGLAGLGKTPEAIGFLTRLLVSDEPGAAQLRDKFLKTGMQGYLGCAVAYEAYVADGSEIRAIRGVTRDERRFVVIRVRGGGEDAVAARVGFGRGKDPTHPNAVINGLLDELNAAFQSSYARLPQDGSSLDGGR